MIYWRCSIQPYKSELRANLLCHPKMAGAVTTDHLSWLNRSHLEFLIRTVGLDRAWRCPDNPDANLRMGNHNLVIIVHCPCRTTHLTDGSSLRLDNTWFNRFTRGLGLQFRERS